MKEILVKTLMTEGVSCLTPEVPLRQAVRQMVENKFSCIIVEKDKSPIGIITERDLVNTLNQESPEKSLSLSLADVMSSPVLCVNQNESLFDAMVVCRSERVRHLSVVDDEDHLVGLVTQSNLANAHFHVTEIQSELIEQAIAAKTSDLQLVNDELRAMAMEDHLMEVGNRRAMEVDLSHTHAGATRYDQIYSVLLLDIDYFKLYNDHYGHQAGDEALSKVAAVLKFNIRAADRIYRYGGEELLVVLPHTNTIQAQVVAKKLVSMLAKESTPHEKSRYGCLTISCGVGCSMKNKLVLATWKTVVEQADRALYQAKEGGRNRVGVDLPDAAPNDPSLVEAR